MTICYDFSQIYSYSGVGKTTVFVRKNKTINHQLEMHTHYLSDARFYVESKKVPNPQ